MAQRRTAAKSRGQGEGAGLYQEVRGLLIAAAGAWFLLSLAGKGGGVLGDLLSHGLRALVGEIGAWALSVLVVWLGLYVIYLRAQQRPFRWDRQAWGILLLFLAFELVVQLVTQGSVAGGGDLENARSGLGGGLVGFVLAVPLTRVFGEAGRWVFVATAALIGLVLGTGLSLGVVLEWLKARFVAGARGAKGVATDFVDLVRRQPGEEGNGGEVAGVPSGRKRMAASEEMNTIGGAPRKSSAEGRSGAAQAELPGAAAGSHTIPIIRQPDLVTEGVTAGPGAAVGADAPAGSAGAGTVGAAATGAAATGAGTIGTGTVGAGVTGAGTTDISTIGTSTLGAGTGGTGTGGRGADAPAKASRTARAGDSAGRKGEETRDVPLVEGEKGQLAIDPSKLGEAYQLPSLSMLPKPQQKSQQNHQDHLARAQLLEHTLRTFGVEARVIEISPGPAVTRYELQPAPGVRVNKFTALADDLALALAAEHVRIEAPIPGKAAVGIEVPNKERLSVHIREVMETPSWLNAGSKLSVAFGKDQAGNPVVGDLAKMPHLLIAGSTGSGKSVCMNTIICSLLFKARPDEVKMMMIDPKMVELSTYNGIPHLMAPVITDVKKAAGYLKGAVKEMENRYELFAAAGVRNITQYNQLCRDDPGPDPEHPRQPLPYVVIFIDELADLMMVAPVDVEDAICRLAQMARACGMHLVIATQSPRVDVITGLIKANIPSRIAFAVSSQVDSRVILDYAGAERLLGKGDMLYHPAGHSKPIRVQGAFIHEREIDQIVKFVKAQAQPVFTAQEVEVEIATRRGHAGGNGDGEPTSALDEAFPQACRIVVEHGQASVSLLQRRLRCNYTKAARLIDMMEERGFIGPHQGSKPREVLLTMPQWQELFGDGGSGGEVASTREE
ncbi:S-DNA-T family DNA segregation ATPase FtsK/SpoIIIE [Symbiobacterium terraclitae]|uniref:S-DNA-T family DNA segregation ATPase FtsK/SpoIIIE n=1 Tax=Symbiobacterium terraclitae TaxID=557451 RepID=A0ABS4JPZ8_9FIRM|nr:S-DNA-T family DNA segregation ATPase FtsK/SpoIIIE [Symbiobacterium terraclitae]